MAYGSGNLVVVVEPATSQLLQTLARHRHPVTRTAWPTSTNRGSKIFSIFPFLYFSLLILLQLLLTMMKLLLLVLLLLLFLKLLYYICRVQGFEPAGVLPMRCCCSLSEMWWLIGEMWWLIVRDVVAHCQRCGGSLSDMWWLIGEM